MADFDAPSFSLGLEFDIDSASRESSKEEGSICNRGKDPVANVKVAELEDEYDKGDELQVADSDPDVESNPDPPRLLKRLRRGAANGVKCVVNSRSLEFCRDHEDDIEAFSSEEDSLKDEYPSLQHHSVCGSSKFHLHKLGLLSRESGSQSGTTERKQVSFDSASANLVTTSDKLFPKLTISPLRKFQLIDSDSDSDDLLITEDASKDSIKINVLSDEKEYKHATPTKEKESKRSSLPQNEDLWKDFCPMKNFHVPTPALDELCEEYFSHVKDKNVVHKQGIDASLSTTKHCYQSKCSSQDSKQPLDVVDSVPPSHTYFFHDDSRIQNLVRSRLHNFFPLGSHNNRVTKQGPTPVIDYLSQFSHGETDKQQGVQYNKVKKSSTKGEKYAKKPNCEVSQVSRKWMIPKSSANVPKDAGRRRVHAEGNSASHWYRSPEGRKVYVTKSGQELTGRLAYRQYRKEGGAGFRKSKKKTRTKKK